MLTTCGIFVFNKKNELLVCHPTNSNMDIWSIPKGLCDQGEDYLDCAIRELEEETTLNLLKYKENIKYITTAKYNSMPKQIVAFVYYMTEDYDNLVCHSMVNDLFPENDITKWESLEFAFENLHPLQSAILQRYLKTK